MKTLKQIKKYMADSNSKINCIDRRDISRLIDFIPCEEWNQYGFELKDGSDKPRVKKFTKKEVLKLLERDLAFAFEKALNQRGLSAGLMHEVIKMWMWVLDDELADFPDSNYAQYGLPLFKAVAIKYKLENPIGEDEGCEDKYASGY